MNETNENNDSYAIASLSGENSEMAVESKYEIR